MTPINSIIAVAPIVAEPNASSALFGDLLGLDFYRLESGYLGTEKLDGITHFGLWPLREAARACFGTDEWPTDLPIPQACIEFTVDDVDVAATDLQAAGNQLLDRAGDEQVVRLLTTDGLVVVLSHEGAAG